MACAALATAFIISGADRLANGKPYGAASGIVAGLVVGGVLSFGRDGLAGELGHMTVVPDGLMCDCGNQG